MKARANNKMGKIRQEKHAIKTNEGKKAHGRMGKYGSRGTAIPKTMTEGPKTAE